MAIKIFPMLSVSTQTRPLDSVHSQGQGRSQHHVQVDLFAGLKIGATVVDGWQKRQGMYDVAIAEGDE